MPRPIFLRNLFAVPLLVLLFISEESFAGIYQLQTQLSPTEQPAVQALLDRAETLLPARLKTAVKFIDVRVEKINLPAGPGGSKRDVVGIAKGHVVTIDSTYLHDIVAGPEGARKTPQRQHKNAYDEALAAVLHESTHVYDERNIHTADEKAWISRCRSLISDGKDKKRLLPSACASYKDMTHTLSQNPYFLAEAGWINGKDKSGYTQRSPDIYENKSPQEYLAVNMEYFLMDPEYKCRRPSMYRLLRDHFEHRPFSDVNCSNNLGYVLSSGASERAQVMAMDPSRVYQIHYVLAGPNNEAMIRFVICAPDKPLDMECIKDIDQNIVLIYRARAGKYPSRLFILPLDQVIDEYAKDGRPPLLSIPLKLSRQEIENFVIRSIETHWSYDGRYDFTGGNSATETFNLIKSSILRSDLMFADVRQEGAKTQMRRMDPVSLRALLNQTGLSDESFLQNKELAQHQGYYFSSQKEQFKNLSVPTFKNGFLKNESGYGIPEVK